jgi:ABC-2 type transport system permease protein
LFVRTVIARAYPRVIGGQRQPVAVALDVQLPLIGLSAYVFVYRALHAPEAYVGFVILGGALIAFWMNVMWAMSIQFYWEKEAGNLALYVMAPASLMAILVGMAAGGMVVATVRAVLILAIGTLVFHVQFSVASVPLLMLVLIVALVALYGMGMTFASLFLLFGREGWHLANLAQEPVYLLSGTYFPVKSMNAWLTAAASLIPLTLALDAVRQTTLAGAAPLGLLTVQREVALLAVLAAIFLALARLSLTVMERLALAHGKITESRG